MKRIDHYRNDYFTRNGVIQPLTYDNYFSCGHEEPTREELVEALHTLTHNPFWNKAIKSVLVIACILIAYVLLYITNVPQP